MGWTIGDIKRANEDAGQHFFSKGAVDFFNSSTLEKVHEGPGGIYFVTAEKFKREDPPKYTVREFDESSGRVNTRGPFNQLGRAQALKLAGVLARGVPVEAVDMADLDEVSA